MNPTPSSTARLLSWAALSAAGAGRKNVYFGDLIVGIYLLCEEEPERLGEVRAALHSRGNRKPVWFDRLPALAARTKLVQIPVGAYPPPLSKAVFRFVETQTKADAALPFAAFVAAFVKVPDRMVEAWVQLNRAPAGRRKSAFVARLEAAFDTADQVMNYLEERVVGQDGAIAMLGDHLFQTLLMPRAGGPRGIFTFFGSPGTGKTMLAEALAGALELHSGRPHAFRRLDMASFSTKQAYEELEGVPSYYTGNREGILTGFVNKNPDAVILFDEIEKAHENTLNALLAVLDKGVMRDKNLQTDVSFAGCWLIFTSNLGREVYDAPSDAGILKTEGLSPARLFDVLATARRRTEAHVDGAPAALPLEFVSRLSKGGAALFNDLDVSDYLVLLEATLTVPVLGAIGDAPQTKVKASDEAALAFLLTLLPALDARRVVIQAHTWATAMVRDAFLHCRRDILDAGPDALRVAASCGPRATAYLQGKLGTQAPRILLVDEEAYFADLVRTGYGAPAPEVTLAATTEDIETAIRGREFDVVFLDLSFQEPAESSRVDTALAKLKHLHARLPSTPIYLFSENPQQRDSFDDIVDRVMRLGGARDFFACVRNSPSAVLSEDFLARLRRAVRDARYERLLREQERSNLSATLQTSYHWDPDLDGVAARIDVISEERIVAAADRGAPVKFSGIPLERFGDVAGLERAKQRLRAVVDWLRDPEALRPFDVAPPKGYLLAGPPGTGKTLLARALAGEAGLPFIALNAAEFRRAGFGESEKRVSDVFAMARRYAPSILFIDEFDAVARTRTDVGDTPQAVLNLILSGLDGFQKGEQPIFCLAATNLPEQLDAAVVRPGRFDEIIPIDPPAAAARRVLFERRLTGKCALAAAEIEKLVRGTAGCTPAVIDRLVREAAYRAASQKRRQISFEDLEWSRRLVRFGASQHDAPLDDALRIAVAHHEAAHALTRLVLMPESVIDIITIVPRESGALGFVASEVEEGSRQFSKRELRHLLGVLLAGREGELIHHGDPELVTAGASSDFKRATELAYHAVLTYGFDEEIGPLSIGGVPQHLAYGLAERAHERVHVWLAEGRDLARRVLAEHRAAFDRIVAQLVENETMSGEDARRLADPARVS